MLARARCRRAPEWLPLWQELDRAGPGPCARAATVASSGARPSCAADARRLLDGDDDVAIVDRCAVTSSSRASRRSTQLGATRRRSTTGQVAIALAALEHEGFALQGTYTRGRDRGRVGVAPPARAHALRTRASAGAAASSRRPRRTSCASCCGGSTSRPARSSRGIDGLAKVISGLQGWEAAAAAWEPELIGRRMRDYDAHALDRLCHEGEIGWLRLAPRPRDVDAPAGAPNKATPISVVFRDDLPWLLDAARDGADPDEPTIGATAEVIEHLRAQRRLLRGRAGSARPAGCPKTSSAASGTACRGAAHRRRVRRDPRPRRQASRPPEPARLSRLMRGARPAPAAAGRWSLVPRRRADATTDRDELAEAVAELLLNRWGVVFRDLAMRESIRFPWREVQRALRRLEDRGLVQGGRFVSGFSGEQFALPGRGRAARARPQAAAHRRTRHRERDRPVQPRRHDRARRGRARDPHPPRHLRRRRAGARRAT